MNSKQKILKAINKHLVQAVPLPEMDQDWIQFDDRISQFLSMLEAVGGHGEVVPNLATVQTKLKDEEYFIDGKEVCSLIDEIEPAIGTRIDLEQVADPHELAQIDLAIVRGDFAVAENGAIWVTDKNVKYKALYFIAQHVVLVVSTKDIVNNMHEAYQRAGIDSDEYQQAAPFGCFISGPSKTADIEQSLVIGAHGARSMRVFLVEELN